jgi:hypothetical protein
VISAIGSLTTLCSSTLPRLNVSWKFVPMMILLMPIGYPLGVLFADRAVDRRQNELRHPLRHVEEAVHLPVEHPPAYRHAGLLESSRVCLALTAEHVVRRLHDDGRRQPREARRPQRAGVGIAAFVIARLVVPEPEGR